jgi:hypothetical protein
MKIQALAQFGNKRQKQLTTKVTKFHEGPMARVFLRGSSCPLRL